MDNFQDVLYHCAFLLSFVSDSFLVSLATEGVQRRQSVVCHGRYTIYILFRFLGPLTIGMRRGGMEKGGLRWEGMRMGGMGWEARFVVILLGAIPPTYLEAATTANRFLYRFLNPGRRSWKWLG